MYIYKIYHNRTLLYIGSTKNNYTCRLHGHKTKIQNHAKTSNFYIYLNNHHITYDDLYIQVIATDIQSSEHLFFYESLLIHAEKPLCNVSCINAIPKYTQPIYHTPVSHTSVKHIFPKKMVNIAVAAVLTSITLPHSPQNYIIFYHFFKSLPNTTVRRPGRPVKT